MAECASCGRSFEPKTKRGRFCSSTCRSRAHRRGPVPVAEVVVLEAREVPGPERPDVVELGSAVGVEASTRRKLLEANRLDDPAGMVALVLARRLDDELTRDTGASVASVAKQHAASLEQALKGAPLEADAVDELRERRRRRFARGA